MYSEKQQCNSKVERCINGVLKRCSRNPRYFSDSSGKPVYLTGSHTWSNMQEYLGPDPLKKFDYNAYLDWMEAHSFNFIRGWAWEEASYDNFSNEKLCIGPLPFARTGPGMAMDGELRFDLNCFNQEYFDRIRERVQEAGKRGIYVSIMLFNKWSINDFHVPGALPWNGHPFNISNNINGVDGDPMGLGGRSIHTLTVPGLLKYQEAYVRKLIDTVNHLENVLYEIGNEHYEDSVEWQYHLIRFIKDYEAGKPLQHPVGITSGGGGPDALVNRQLFESPADWISPRDEVGMNYKEASIAADGSRVIISDTDHLGGLGSNIHWVWKSFTQGYNTILMDPYEPIYRLENYAVEAWTSVNDRNHPMWQPIRNNMTYAAGYAQRMNLQRAIPCPELASSGYCLAERGHEYLVYVCNDSEVVVDLGDEEKKYAVEWMNIQNGYKLVECITAKAKSKFTNPFSDSAVLYIAETGKG